MNKIQQKAIRCVLDAGEYILVRQIKAVKPEKCPGIILGYLLEGLQDKNDYGTGRRNYAMSDEYAVKLLNLYRGMFITVNAKVQSSQIYYATLMNAFLALPSEEYSPPYFERYPELTKNLIGGISECMGIAEAIKFVVSRKPHEGWSYRHGDFFGPIVDKLCERLHYPKGCEYDQLLVDLTADYGDVELYRYAIERVSLCRVKKTSREELLSEALKRLEPGSVAA